jgi:hypothetical protein
MISFLLAGGCIKETYDMNRVSKDATLQPSVGMPVFTGKTTLADMVNSNENFIPGQNEPSKLVYTKDSVIDLQLKDLYNLDQMVTFTKRYTLGDIKINPFSGSLQYDLGDISNSFTPALKTMVQSLDDGNTHLFPAFPSLTLPNRTLTGFSNIEYAIFSEGIMDYTVTNNLPAPLNSMSISLSNSDGPVGITISVPPLNPGESYSGSVSLSGYRITNAVSVSITLSGNNGTNPAVVSLHNNKILFSLLAHDLKLSAGKALLPAQSISAPGSSDVITFDAGEGVELDEIKINSAQLKWNVTSTASLGVAMNLNFPTVKRNDVALNENFVVNPGASQNGSISFNNTIVKLNSDPEHPFNKVPFSYNLSINSGSNMVQFTNQDAIVIGMGLTSPDFDYMKGFFGQEEQSIDADVIDLDMDEILNKISGNFFFASPLIKLNYTNSFAFPIEVNFNAKGIKGSQTVNLGLAPFAINYPESLSQREISSSFSISRNNSSLAELISMPPESIEFSGSAKMNPGTIHTRNNYIFGNSSFLGSVEVEVPLEFSLQNLQFADTTENFLSGEDVPDFKSLKLSLNVKNGFPLDASLTLKLYDSVTRTVKGIIDAPQILKSAPVDSNGKATGVTESSTVIEFAGNFLNNLDNADRIIFNFKLNTAGQNNIKIYSDYAIDLNAAIIVKPEIELK